MVKKDSRNKREYERKQGQGSGAQNTSVEKKGKSSNDRISKETKDGGTSKPPSNFQGVKEDATKLITEANQRFLEEQITNDPSSENKWKKTVTSNWDRYEMEPSDDEEGADDEMTGQAWDLAFSSGSSSQGHIRLKEEENWSTSGESGGAQLSKEFFNLDLNILDDLLKCVPVHKQIDLETVMKDEETFEMFDKKADEYRKLLSSNACDTSEINNKMMSLLTTQSPPKTPKSEVVKPEVENERSKKKLSLSPHNSSTNRNYDLSVKIAKTSELKANNSVSVVVPSEPQEQRQRKNRNRRVMEDAKPDQKVLMTEEGRDPAYDSRTQDKSDDIPEIPTKIEKSPSFSNTESEDMQFLSSLEKMDSKSIETANVQEDDNESESESVVPVTIIDDTEKKGLEDWLDDFLGD